MSGMYQSTATSQAGNVWKRAFKVVSGCWKVRSILLLKTYFKVISRYCIYDDVNVWLVEILDSLLETDSQ